MIERKKYLPLAAVAALALATAGCIHDDGNNTPKRTRASGPPRVKKWPDT